MIARLLAACLSMSALLAGGSARAQALNDEDLLPATRSYVSAERFITEFRGGPYRPSMDGDPAFRTFFADDLGPMLSAELDVIAFRIDDILYVTGGGSIGLASFSGSALGPSGPVSEETSLSIIPLIALATVRFDALPRKLQVPFSFAAKIGWEWAHWDTATGQRDDASGWSVGMYYAAQIALDLDTLEPGAARSMDEEWGINHSFVLFELNHFAPTSRSLPIGDDLAWVLGLGFTF